MKSKINSRLVGISILAIVSTVIGITLIYYNLFQTQIRQDLSISAKLLKDTHYFESVNINTDTINLSTDITELRVTWIDTDGTVLYDNDASTQSLSNHMNRPEIQDAFLKGEGECVRQSNTMNKSTYYYAVLLDNGTVLRIATTAKSLGAVFFSVAPITLLILLMIISICIAISHMLTMQLLKPIDQMAENLENSDYSAPYKELEPISEKLKSQHIDILSAAKARQDFTANVSHELKTPLTAILGYTELLENGIVGKDKEKHFYQEIHKNVDRLLALINDIIRLSELDRHNKETIFEDVDLFTIVSESMELLRINANRRNIQLTLEGSSCFVHGNKDLLKELVENLVQNAIRYNNDFGKVKIVVEKEDGHSTLTVIDNGIGIPSSEQSRIFERFYRVDKSRSKATGGTGLGLAIVKHIVEIHNAKINLVSSLGIGTTIKVLF
ncbi:MAG: ATP-binding protein [Bacillota bacterium]|nr:ATP-binding protein [Bacillota bacterium]